MSENLTRAELFKKAIGFAGQHISEVVEKKVEKFLPSGVTPPWALETSSFLATCEKCGACGEICPKGVIYYHTKDNRVFGGTPYLDFSSSFCDYCGECVKVCPSGALSFENGVKELGVAKITRDLCVISAEDCGSHCVGSCPESAISIDFSGDSSGFPVVDLDVCNGCGGCIAGCKAGAIKIR